MGREYPMAGTGMPFAVPRRVTGAPDIDQRFAIEALTFSTDRVLAVLHGLRPQEGGGITVTADENGVELAGGGGSTDAQFSGIVWVAGKKFDLTAETPEAWIKVDVDGDAVTYDATGPASEAQFEDGVEWYRRAYTYGDLHVTRF